jgi:hypothetical protein
MTDGEKLNLALVLFEYVNGTSSHEYSNMTSEAMVNMLANENFNNLLSQTAISSIDDALVLVNQFYT